MNGPRQVLVVAKAPLAGGSKTRLVPPLSSGRAAELAGAMLLDTLEDCTAEADVVGVLCPSRSEAAALAEFIGPEVAVHVQAGRGLGAALREQMRTGTVAGPLALVSSDVPGLPQGALTRSFERLRDGADLVLGPGFDGGYWMIAMERFHEEPFRDIPWSTPACASVTLERARSAGLRAVEVETWLDIDTSVDLSVAIHAPPGPLGARSALALARIGADVEVPPPPSALLVKGALIEATPWRSAVRDQLDTGAGGRSDYLYLATPRAVFVVAVTRAGEMLLVRQYRHPVRDWTLEVPAGSVDDGESPRTAAARELAEETGAHGGIWRHLGTFFSSSAHLSLRSDAFLATDLDEGRPHPEPGEQVVVVRLPVGEVLARARRGEITEGQTALSLLLAAPHLES